VIFYPWVVSQVEAKGKAGSQYPGSSRNEAIHITSDKMESNSKLKWIEFVGHVRATQRDIVITANRIKIFYKSESTADRDINRPERIVATGRVRIFTGDGRAEAEMVVYTVEDDTLVLSGNPRVWIGKNMISGQRITLFGSEERSLVTGDEKNQVKANIFLGSK